MHLNLLICYVLTDVCARMRVYSMCVCACFCVSNQILHLVQKLCFIKRTIGQLSSWALMSTNQFPLIPSFCNFSHQPLFSFFLSFFTLLIILFTLSFPLPRFVPTYICQAKVMSQLVYHPEIMQSTSGNHHQPTPPAPQSRPPRSSVARNPAVVAALKPNPLLL